jgi:hypothetical protein
LVCLNRFRRGFSHWKTSRVSALVAELYRQRASRIIVCPRGAGGPPTVSLKYSPRIFLFLCSRACEWSYSSDCGAPQHQHLELPALTELTVASVGHTLMSFFPLLISCPVDCRFRSSQSGQQSSGLRLSDQCLVINLMD